MSSWRMVPRRMMVCCALENELARVPSMIRLPLGNTSTMRTATLAVICCELLIWPPPAKSLLPLRLKEGMVPFLVSRPLAAGLYKKLEMAESMLESFEVLVVLSLLALEFSWTRMVTISPTWLARLSAYCGLDRPSCQSESADSVAVKPTHRPSSMAARASRRLGRRRRMSKCDSDSLFIQDLSAEF